MKKRNKFAKKLMKILNEDLLEKEHGSPTIEVVNPKDNGDALYNKKGEIMFQDCEGELFSATELFAWYNILMHDKDYIDDQMITLTMINWHGKAIDKGYIDSKTPKVW